MEIRNVLGLCALSGALVLTACGGGGGGSSASPIDGVIATGEANALAMYTPEQQAPLSVPDTTTADNAAKFAVGLPQNIAGDYGVDMTGSSSGTVSGVSIAGASTNQSAEIPVAIMTKLGTRLAGVTQSVSGQFCGSTGTYSGTAQAASQYKMTAGDYAIITFNECAFDPTGPTFNGQLAYRVNSVSGDPVNDPYGAFTLSQTFGAVGFSITQTDGTKFSLNGGYTAAVTSNYTAGTFGVQFSGNAFSMNLHVLDTSSSTGFTDRDLLLTKFNQKYSLDSGVVTYSNNMTVASKSLNASITIVTNSSFVMSQGSYPYQGQMVIKGANGQSIQITAGGDATNPNVTVEYDLNANGVYSDTDTNGVTDPAPRTNILWTAL